MNTPIVSVIVTVYNTEQFLSRCFDSVLSQTFKDIEMIIVNDGSKDGSMEIINRYASSYNNIKVVDKQNGGAAEARRSGVQVAAGEYIMHVDSDDWLPLNSVELLYNKCIEFDLDYAKGVEYVYFSEDYHPLYQHSYTGILVGSELLDYATRIDGGLPSSSSLYHRSIWLEDIYPPSNVQYPSEDLLMSIKISLHIKRAGIFNDIPVYYYYQNPNSASKSGYLIKGQANWVMFFAEVRRFLQLHELLPEYEERIRIWEIDRLSFCIAKIDTEDDWYKSIYKYDSSKYSFKYKVLHNLIKYPPLLKLVIATDRLIKQIVRHRKAKNSIN